MFKSKTLFVVGAGASSEVKLPVGSELKSRIASKLDIRFRDGHTQQSGDYEIMAALCHIAKNGDGGREDVNDYLGACWMIRDAMPQASSIDVFVDAHRDNPMVEVCGKLGISSSILEAERQSLLYHNPRNVERMDLATVSSTWYSRFFEMAVDRASRAEVDAALSNASFITFNYDRCVEHFLVSALQNYYGINEDQAQEHVRKIVIHHPYGSVGPLPWQDQEGQVSFGGEANSCRLTSAVSRLKTFTERIEEGSSIDAIRQQVENARTIIFLGFAFHSQNLELIAPKKASKIERIFGTAFGISNADCLVLEEDLRVWTRQKTSLPRIELRNDLTCEALFTEYRRTMSAL